MCTCRHRDLHTCAWTHTYMFPFTFITCEFSSMQYTFLVHKAFCWELNMHSFILLWTLSYKANITVLNSQVKKLRPRETMCLAPSPRANQVSLTPESLLFPLHWTSFSLSKKIATWEVYYVKGDITHLPLLIHDKEGKWLAQGFMLVATVSYIRYSLEEGLPRWCW